MTQDNDLTRYFIVTSGRSGSSLLAAVLADAGADFGMDVADDWDRGRGALEHPAFDAVSRLFRRARYLGGGKRYFLFYKYLADARRSRGKKRLARALRDIRYAKMENVDLWIWHAVKLGYRPRIIVSYRRFVDSLPGYYVIHGIEAGTFADFYVRTYRNGLMMLSVFGGCAVAYEELADPAETAWADALSRTTGLSQDALVAARDQRLSQPPAAVDASAVDAPAVDAAAVRVPLTVPEAEDVFADLATLKGRFVPPGRAILRRWG